MSLDIAENIRRHGFKRLLLAVSGGLDSICLAHYFICNKDALGFEWLGIAHVHHGLREGTADRDAAFVEAFAKAHDIPFFLKKLDGEALKNAEGSLEENARDARYRALQEAAEGCDVIVTAHHAGDQAETMYMRLRRGTTLAGLRGIQALRQAHFGHAQCRQGPYRLENFSNLSQDDTSYYIYRPLLNTTRAELLEYARENNLDWCEDESNSDVKFARNKIRHEFLPRLEELCPGVAMQLCRIAQLADKAYAKVMNEGESIFAPVLRAVNADADRSLPWKAMGQHDLKACVALDKKRLRKVLREHASADLSEMFRLWLSEQGFRFPFPHPAS